MGYEEENLPLITVQDLLVQEDDRPAAHARTISHTFQDPMHYSARLFLIRSIFFPQASIAGRSLDFKARL